MVAPGSPDALGEQKHRFSLGFSRFETKNIDFLQVFQRLGPKIGPQFRQKVQKPLCFTAKMSLTEL